MDFRLRQVRRSRTCSSEGDFVVGCINEGAMSRIEEETPHSRLHRSGHTCALGPECCTSKEPGRACGLGAVPSKSCLLECSGSSSRGSEGRAQEPEPWSCMCPICGLNRPLEGKSGLRRNIAVCRRDPWKESQEGEVLQSWKMPSISRPQTVRDGILLKPPRIRPVDRVRDRAALPGTPRSLCSSLKAPSRPPHDDQGRDMCTSISNKSSMRSA